MENLTVLERGKWISGNQSINQSIHSSGNRIACTTIVLRHTLDLVPVVALLYRNTTRVFTRVHVLRVVVLGTSYRVARAAGPRARAAPLQPSMQQTQLMSCIGTLYFFILHSRLMYSVFCMYSELVPRCPRGTRPEAGRGARRVGSVPPSDTCEGAVVAPLLPLWWPFGRPASRHHRAKLFALNARRGSRRFGGGRSR